MKYTDVNQGSGLFRSGELETAGKSCATQYLILQCLVATWILSAIVRQTCSPTRRAQKRALGHRARQKQEFMVEPAPLVPQKQAMLDPGY